MLDTNIVSDLIRNPVGDVTRRLAAEGEDSVAVSIIVAAELRYGSAKRGSPRLNALVDGMLRRITVLPLRLPADSAYGAIRTSLEARGRPIGHNDLLIAAHALTLDLPLVTDNVGEFTRVPGLRVENWLRAA
jgi:tRNA(fMet)-specific endonuclease VapC